MTRLKLDENLGASAVAAFAQAGHDVTTVISNGWTEHPTIDFSRFAAQKNVA